MGHCSHECRCGRSQEPQVESLRIGLTYDLREDYLAMGWSEQDVAEFDRADTIDALETAITARGHVLDRIGSADRLIERLARGDRWDLVFNVCEGTRGVGREALVPALLDHAAIPYTFADPLACATTLDKPTTKRILRDNGLPTPPFAVVHSLRDLEGVQVLFPAFAKLAREGSSKGIDQDCLARTPEALRQVCSRLLRQFAPPVLVESYLPGREVTVGLIGTGAAAEVVGVLEVVIDSGDEIYAYDTKERCEELVTYRLADDEFARRAADLAVAAYRALDCRDAGRVDIRADASGEPSVIEINCLPGLHPSHSDLPIMAGLAGVRYDELIGRILDSALARLGSAAPAAATVA